MLASTAAPAAGLSSASSRASGGRHLAGDEPSLALDPASRHAAQLAPPQAHVPVSLDLPPSRVAPPPPAGTAGAASQVPASLEDLMPGLVRKVAWSGDGRRAAMRLELGSGALAGATIVVQATGSRVDVTVVTLAATAGSSQPPQARAELEAWRDRIAARLEARGIDVGSIDVT